MATQTEYFLAAHPRGTEGVDIDLWRACIERLAACAQACTACADSCLGESGVSELVRCVRLCLDCADVCSAAERVVMRRTEGDRDLLRAVLATCVRACRACVEECERHAEAHEHCRLCADTCRLGAAACEDLLRALGEPATEAAGR